MQFDRHRQIAQASTIEWRGITDAYSADLWVSLIDAQDRARTSGESVTLVFGNKLINATLTDIEDILELVRAARTNIARARGLAAA